ncbi:hypothetical protein L1887_61610 [Cichorium endivia]|nr:hypothetical protein L1887_61610 [Cichorium endivia]
MQSQSRARVFAMPIAAAPVVGSRLELAGRAGKGPLVARALYLNCKAMAHKSMRCSVAGGSRYDFTSRLLLACLSELEIGTTPRLKRGRCAPFSSNQNPRAGREFPQAGSRQLSSRQRWPSRNSQTSPKQKINALNASRGFRWSHSASTASTRLAPVSAALQTDQKRQSHQAT